MPAGKLDKGLGNQSKMRDRVFLFFYKYIKIAKDCDLTIDEQKTFYYMIINYGIYGRKVGSGTTPKLNVLFETAREHMKRVNATYELVEKDKW